MSIGNSSDDEKFVRLFDPKCVREVYKDPDAHLAQVKEIMERCTVCPSCGKKEIEVLSVEEQRAKCKNCGAELK